jgi:glycine/D-amino acid oxidase-like deaminating enzyme
MSDQVTQDFRFAPWWWEAAPPPESRTDAPSGAYDHVVIGSGFTGVSAALHLARGGRSVALLDSERLGAGASRRNAGFIGRVMKKSFGDVADARDEAYARKTYEELHAAYEGVFDLAEAEGIACHAARCGRFIAATAPGHRAYLDADLARLKTALGHDFEVLGPERQREAIASEHYHGGVVIPDSGSIHPGLLHEGLLDRAIAAGVAAFGETRVNEIHESDQGVRLETTRGEITAREVVLATNGYTQHPGWYKRRLVPFRAFMATTEPLDPALLDALIPHGRTIIDSNTNIDFFRRAPDAPRLVFGGATAEKLADEEAIAARMRKIMLKVFPQLGDVRLSHVWDGYCAGTFDMKPHVGQRGRLHYALGYNFAGVALGCRFGKRIADRILGKELAASAFDGTAFPTMPLYTGHPWFIGAAMRYFAWRDAGLAKRWDKAAQREQRSAA